MMPAVPAFAGDLKSEGALGTRAIMEFQYNSINRGGYSIIETLHKSGVEDPHRYINFYNLRSYDRINTSAAMARAEQASGVRYEDARRGFDDRYERGDDRYERDDRRDEYRRDDYRGGDYQRDEYSRDEYSRDEYSRDDYSRDDSLRDDYRRDESPREDEYRRTESQYQRYQEAASHITDQTWDTISAAYMKNGPDLHSIPWSGSPESELGAFVSEQLYIHSKVLIADDQLVICGSANLNDRSQLGNHDSEIAVIIEDPTPAPTYMAGRPFTASAFAASLRRYLFRKHLGLLPDQRSDAADRNWTPVSHHTVNDYDWDSAADKLVQDPLAHEFIDLWRGTARRNTEIFSRAFHAVPDDKVRTWDDYDAFFSKHFVIPGESAEDADKGYKAGKVDYGHVVREEFPGGVRELKDWLGGVRGTLVEMPLQFLIDVDDLAKDGLALNSLTDDLYT